MSCRDSSRWNESQNASNNMSANPHSVRKSDAKVEQRFENTKNPADNLRISKNFIKGFGLNGKFHPPK